MPEKAKLKIIATEWNSMDEAKKKVQILSLVIFRFGRTLQSSTEENILTPSRFTRRARPKPKKL